MTPTIQPTPKLLATLVAALVLSAGAWVALAPAPLAPAESAAGAASVVQAEPVGLPEFVAASLNTPRFEENHGQAAPEVRYLSKVPGRTLYFTPDEVILSFLGPASPTVEAVGGLIRLRFLDASPDVRVFASEPTGSTANYFLGNDPAKWRTGVQRFARLHYEGLWPGIDAVFYTNVQGALEQDYVVHAGADAAAIRFEVRGAEPRLDEDALVLDAPAASVKLMPPYAYQISVQGRSNVPSEYVLDKTTVALRVGAYDATRDLVIDPIFNFATYYGGSTDGSLFGGGEDIAYAITTDTAGNFYVAGTTSSKDLDVQYGSLTGKTDVFVAKWLSNQTQAVFTATYLGGASFDSAAAIAVDGNSDIYITGTTWSTDFPSTSPIQASNAGDSDAFVTKLRADASTRLYSTYLGGSAIDEAKAIAVDTAGAAYITGSTWSTNFPNTTATAFQPWNSGKRDIFLTKVNPDGSAWVNSTYLGGTNHDIALDIHVDGNGVINITGATRSSDFNITNAYQSTYGGGLHDAFLATLDLTRNPLGQLVHSTFLGGSGDDYATSLARAANGSMFIAGVTLSNNFPLANNYVPWQATRCGFEDGFVSRLNITTTGTSALGASTYYGGRKNDYPRDLLLDANGNAYIAGHSWSATLDCPGPQLFANTSPDPTNALSPYGFVSRLDANLTRSHFDAEIGAERDDVAFSLALNSTGGMVVAGFTNSYQFPLNNTDYDAYKGGIDSFVVRIQDPVGIKTIVQGERNPCLPRAVTIPSPFKLPLGPIGAWEVEGGTVAALELPRDGCSTTLNLSIDGSAATRLLLRLGLPLDGLGACAKYNVTLDTTFHFETGTVCGSYLVGPNTVGWQRLEARDAQGNPPMLV